MTEGNEVKRSVPSAKASSHDEDRSSTASSGTDAKRASERIGGLRAVPDTKSVRTTAAAAVLELGAGTGICGMAASLSLGCPVTAPLRRVKCPRIK